VHLLQHEYTFEDQTNSASDLKHLYFEASSVDALAG
jgi:hypothetical protein